MSTPGLLSNKQIREALGEAMIYAHPFDDNNIGTNSYDVRLGRWFYREQPPVTTSPIYNIYDEKSVGRIWGLPQQAETYQYIRSTGHLPPNMANIHDDDLLIILKPGETILGHTQEFIGGRAGAVSGITSKMHARSSIGRSMIGVCKCAGLGDAGFINRWTMEITSFSQHHYIPLVVGRRIAQIEFQHLTSMEGNYAEHGKYQTELEPEAVMKAWRPEMMLPLLHLDRELDDSSD